MRARFAPLGADRLTFTFEGKRIEARKGETVAAALTAAGILSLRRIRSGGERGLFCGMGVCQDCLVQINGTPSRRACMTKVESGMQVEGQGVPCAKRVKVPSGVPLAMPRRCDVLVVGGGPAGLSAAITAAETGVKVMLVDERPVLGGQFYKQPISELDLPASRLADAQFSGGRALIARARAAEVHFVNGVVFSAGLPASVAVECDGRGMTIDAQRLILATGAFERPLPVPGWTLPGVMTTGAAQTLLRSYGVVAGRRMLIAGNGPLNLQVAVELHRAGAAIVAMVEAAPPPGLGNLASLGRMAVNAPDLMLDGIGYVAALRWSQIPVIHGAAIDRIDAGERLAVTLTNGQRYRADVVCMGYGFLPSNELARLLGCRHHYDAAHGFLRTARDKDGRTSIDTVFAIGDGTGLGGARAAEAEGVIAGLAAAIDIGARPSAAARANDKRVRANLERQRRFQQALWQLFRRDPELSGETSPGAVVCRCEEVSAGSLADHVLAGAPIGSVKRATRLGMGRCQARYCGPLAVNLLATGNGHCPSELDFPAPRPPTRPVTLAVLAELGRESDCLEATREPGAGDERLENR
jgi:D-hydroxyproline dehydrogenase subunit alpha